MNPPGSWKLVPLLCSLSFSGESVDTHTHGTLTLLLWASLFAVPYRAISHPHRDEKDEAGNQSHHVLEICKKMWCSCSTHGHHCSKCW